MAALATAAAAEDSGTSGDRSSRALCQTPDVIWRIPAVEKEIAASEERARDLVSENNLVNEDYNSPSGRMPKLAKELADIRRETERLKNELLRLRSLPPCNAQEYMDISEDECLTSEVEAQIAYLKKLLAEARLQLATDLASRHAATAGLARAGYAETGAAERLSSADAGILYDLRLIRRFQEWIAELEQLPPCDHDHPARVPGHERSDGQGDYGSEPEPPEESAPVPPGSHAFPDLPPDKSTDTSPDNEKRPEIGSVVPAKKKKRDYLGNVLSTVTIGVGADSNKGRKLPSANDNSVTVPPKPSDIKSSPPE